MNPYKVRRRWIVTYQFGADGQRREKEFSRFRLFVLVLVCLGVLALAGLYLYNLQYWARREKEMSKLKQENAALRQKLDYYSGVVDSIYKHLESLDMIKQTPSQADRYYPYYSGDKSDPLADNTFIYDPYLDARVNSIEQQVRGLVALLEPEEVLPPAVVDSIGSYYLTIAGGPSIWPAFGRLSDGWGLRFHPIYRRLAFHSGMDISNKTGTPVYATADGEVIQTGYDRGYGKVIKIRHGGGFETRYAHLYSFQANVGELVRKGQIIGLMGNTGLSTGPHLHYEVLLNGNKVNPSRYLNRFDDPVYYTMR